ncbi:uncharacterized protein [Diadema setosum]|uniref:uncharacterized protein n=1 Tax=Diadema setosum TaxID=31175 RepID=UPI003B3ACDF2
MSGSGVSRLVTILQLADTGFPTGAFSHSLGFESAVKQGHIRNHESFNNFITSAMENAGSSCLPFVKAGYEGSENLSAICSLDAYCDACLNNHIANRASSQQGKSLILTASEAFPDKRIGKLHQIIQERQLKGHHAVMFGALCAHLDIPLMDCLETYMFNNLKTMLASVVRLGNMGPLQAQKHQYEHQKNIRDIIARNYERTVQESCLRFPLVDIVQNTHDTLFSRLFSS